MTVTVGSLRSCSADLAGRYRQKRTGGPAQDPRGRTATQGVEKPVSPFSGHHDQIRLEPCGNVENFVHHDACSSALLPRPSLLPWQLQIRHVRLRSHIQEVEARNLNAKRGRYHARGIHCGLRQRSMIDGDKDPLQPNGSSVQRDEPPALIRHEQAHGA